MYKKFLDYVSPVWDPLRYIERYLDGPGPEQTFPTDAKAFLEQLRWMLSRRTAVERAGPQHSRTLGQGLDFSNLREYFPGDDIRKLDWNVFARTLSPHIREYQEEKQITLWLAIDFSPSMFNNIGFNGVGGEGKWGNGSKAMSALTLAGGIALLGQKTGSRVGFYVWNGMTRIILLPKTGLLHLQQAMQRILNFIPDCEQLVYSKPECPPLQAHLSELGRVIGPKNIAFFLSDFLDLVDTPHLKGGGEIHEVNAGSSKREAPSGKHIPSPLEGEGRVGGKPGTEHTSISPIIHQETLQTIGLLSQKCTLSHFLIRDPHESFLPDNLGLLDVFDPESQRVALMDCSSQTFCDAYHAAAESQVALIQRHLRETGRLMEVWSTESPVEIFQRFFLGRGSLR